MYTGKTKKFKDTIHGYIEIPEIIVDKIIDTELFQRLHYIEQTSMRPLYPAARHDRFIHSLGVYWLGREVFANFRSNAMKELKDVEMVKLTEEWWQKQELLFWLACLLHDCAHSPFSHTLEYLYVMRKVEGTKRPELDDILIRSCQEDDEAFTKDFNSNGVDEKGVGAPHEKMSAYCAIHEYREAISEITKEILGTDIEIEKGDMTFVVRMIIGCLYKDTAAGHNSIKNCIIQMLNSPSIDVDGLDYIVRDAYMSGSDTFSIDYRRLLSSFTIVPVEVYNNVNAKDENIDVNGIWLKGSIFTVKNISGQINGKIVVTGIAKEEYESIYSINKEIKVQSDMYISREETRTQFDELQSGIIEFTDSCDVKKCKFEGVITGKRIVSAMSPITNKGMGCEYVLGYAKNSLSIIQSTIEARNHSYMWVYSHPKVLYCSTYLQCELLRDSAKYLCCCENKEDFETTILDFDCEKCPYYQSEDKEKVLEDYLLNILGYATFLDKNAIEFPELRKKGFSFYRTCDDDLIALFKRIFIENKARKNNKSEKLEKDLNEFFSRQHRNPLWKSFVEYEKFINTYLSTTGLQTTFRKFCNRVVSGASKYCENYNYLSEEQQEIWDEKGINNVLLIKSKIKMKELNVKETFIKFNDQVLRLADIFDTKDFSKESDREFYYIFADGDNEISKEKFEELVGELKKVIE